VIYAWPQCLACGLWHLLLLPLLLLLLLLQGHQKG
jgi:hypothetical protein